MNEKMLTSSREILRNFALHSHLGGLDAETIYQRKREIEKKMEKFDMENREKAAKSQEDLGKIIITAYILT
jgi:hypothetical protein